MKTPQELLQESLMSFKPGQWVKYEHRLCRVESPNLAAGKLMVQEVDATGEPMGELLAVNPFAVRTPAAAEIKAVTADAEIEEIPRESISELPDEIPHGKVAPREREDFKKPMQGLGERRGRTAA